MKIVLREDVDNLGQKGDLVDVADGYARNYLVPRGLAFRRRRPGSQKQADAMRRNRDAREPPRPRGGAGDRRAVRGPHDLDQGARRRRGPPVRLGHRRLDIAEAVQKQTGVEIDRRELDLDEPLKELGGADVPVRLHPDVVATLHVEVEAELTRRPTGLDCPHGSCHSPTPVPGRGPIRCGQR